MPMRDSAQRENYFKRVTILAPLAVPALWFAVISVGVWFHARASEEPPVYDALGYFTKARNFWLNLHSTKPINPFNLDPAFRPPGTVLMSFPFGFSADFHWFYFRSVIFPVALMIVAVYVTLFERKSTPRERWLVAALALTYASASMFFHFENSNGRLSPVIWGIVDNFLGGISALSAAMAVRSILHKSLGWAFVSWLVAAFALLIKPSGALVMLVVATGWTFGLLVSIGRASENRPSLIRLLRNGVISMALVFAPVTFLSFHSEYLSAANIAWGASAIEIMRHELSLSFSLAAELLRASFGYLLPLTALIVVAVWPFLGRRQMSDSATEWAFWFFGIFTLAFGAWYWLIGSAGATQIRYFFPFATMGFIFLLPAAANLLRRSSVWIATGFGFVVAVWTINVALILLLPASSAWERWSGVNVNTGRLNSELRLARNLVAESRKRGRSASVYSLYTNDATAAFESVGRYEAVLHPDKPTFDVKLPLDWRRPSAVRLDQLVGSEYVLFGQAEATQRENILSSSRISTFQQELDAFDAWFTMQSTDAGVETAAETPSLRLVRVSNAAVLERSIDQFRAGRRWPSSFDEINPQHWWSKQQLQEYLGNTTPPVADVNFGQLFRVDALLIKHESGQIVARIWWERMNKPQYREWHFFLHLLDAHGKIIQAEQVELPTQPPAEAATPIALDVLNFPPPRGVKVAGLGIGIYSGQETLLADKGKRDWGNRRDRKSVV